MEHNIKQNSGERLSFFKMFSQKHYKLVIPIIQRDYAQGRTNEATKEVRLDFLDALFGYLEEGKPSRDLDFVYGTLQKDEEDDHIHFIPLDGQQRLTTLFLLHWFLFQIQPDTEDGKHLQKVYRKALTDGGKSLFTYKTRQSSTDFCDSLMMAEIDMENLLIEEDSKGKSYKSLAKTIKNEHWYYRIWNNDPTVQSMLVMLDAIYTKFNGHPEFLTGLMDENEPVITFIFKDLKEYKLTDDLYIKMNSRGKPLSKFENFKAKFEQYIKQQQEKDLILKEKKYTLQYSSVSQEVDFYRYFSFNIDTKWTTLFWQYCKNGKEKNLDTCIENFIRVILTCHYASIVELPNKAKSDETLDILMSIDSDYKSLSFSKYEMTKALNAESLIMLVDALDALYNGVCKIKNVLSDDYNFYFNESEIFNKVLTNDLSRNERIQFYAYVQFLIHNHGVADGIDQWMRVVHNISHPDNSVIDGNDDMARGMRSIKSLLPYSNDIVSYLKNNTISGFAKHQIDEECIKAQLLERQEWKSLIETVEKHSYFNGQIGFLLEFAGICDDYSKDHSLNWDNSIEQKKLNLFKKYATIASYMFELDSFGERHHNVNYCFERAVLQQGDYLMGASSSRYNLLSTETVSQNVKRDLSWKRLLRINETKTELLESKQYVKAVFDNVSDINDITGSIESQCVGNTGDEWRDLFINTPDFYVISEKGFTAFYDDQLLILKHWFSNMYHVEAYTYHLWLTKFDVFTSSRYFNYEYKEQKTWDITPWIRGSKFTYRRCKYHIDIQASINPEDYSLSKFLVSFAFDNEKRDDYPEELMTLLTGLKFKKSENDNSYKWTSKQESRIMKKLADIEDAITEILK